MTGHSSAKEQSVASGRTLFSVRNKVCSTEFLSRNDSMIVEERYVAPRHPENSRAVDLSLPSVKKSSAHVILFETEGCLMKITCMIVAVLLLVLGFTQTCRAGSSSAENRKKEENKGVTVEDLGRGLKSAGQNIEKEIPKIGPAIGNAAKKRTEKGSEKPATQEPAKKNNK
jgi:hypothetical protein